MMNLSPSVTKSKIDFSQLLEVMRPADTGEGLRMQEIKELTGASERRIAKALRKGIEAGLVRVSRKLHIDLIGRPQWPATYIICTPEQEVAHE